MLETYVRALRSAQRLIYLENQFLDDETVAKDLQKVVKTRKTELLFLVLMIRMLRNGGRAAVIVPEGAAACDTVSVVGSM